MSDKEKVIAGVLGIVLIVVAAITLIICVPFAVVWSLNVLFKLELAYTFETWLAVSIIGWLVNANTWAAAAKRK